MDYIKIVKFFSDQWDTFVGAIVPIAALLLVGWVFELLSKVGDAGFRRRVRLAFLHP